MTKQLLRRACVRALMRHFTGSEARRPSALGCKLLRAEMTVGDLAIVWATIGDEMRTRRADGVRPPAPAEWDALHDLLVEYETVMRERSRSPRRTCGGPTVTRARRQTGPVAESPRDGSNEP